MSGISGEVDEHPARSNAVVLISILKPSVVDLLRTHIITRLQSQ